MRQAMAIGAVARHTGIPAKTIRYYEEAGLLPRAHRAENGYRLYDDSAVDVLRFVRRARNLDFSMHEVAKLLALWKDDRRASADVRKLATRHIEELERKIAQLEALRRVLVRLVERCHGDARPECPILDDIAGSDAH